MLCLPVFEQESGKKFVEINDESGATGTFRVRVATPADQPAVKALVAAVLEEFGIVDDPCSKQDEDLDDLAGWYPAPRGLFEVIENPAGALLGCGGIHPLDDHSCELRKLYFLPALRGCGVGSAMLDRLVRFARQAGYRRLELETASVLETAIGLYQRRGFVEITNRHGIARCDRAFELDLAEYRAPANIASIEG